MVYRVVILSKQDQREVIYFLGVGECPPAEIRRQICAMPRLEQVHMVASPESIVKIKIVIHKNGCQVLSM
jgi:hypothetical protein